MRPYGENHKIRYNFKDNHPKNGYVNWWDDIGSILKKRARREGKDEIRKQLDEMRNTK